MTGFALATAVVLAAALVGSVRAVRQRRRALQRKTAVLARAGGRALVAHLGAISRAGSGLEVPSAHGAWRRLGSIPTAR